MNNISDLNNKTRQTSGYVYHTPAAIFLPNKPNINNYVNYMRMNRYLLT